MARRLALWPALLATACSSVSSGHGACGPGTRLISGQCRVVCGGDAGGNAACLLDEQCDVTFGVCVLRPGTLDAGTGDGADAGRVGVSVDAGADAGTPRRDAGVLDGATPPADAGALDATPAGDAGALDGAAPPADAGGFDGGTADDGGALDAAPSGDGGSGGGDDGGTSCAGLTENACANSEPNHCHRIYLRSGIKMAFSGCGTGPANCTMPTLTGCGSLMPVCGSGYRISYTSTCYEGCVLSFECP